MHYQKYVLWDVDQKKTFKHSYSKLETMPQILRNFPIVETR